MEPYLPSKMRRCERKQFASENNTHGGSKNAKKIGALYISQTAMSLPTKQLHGRVDLLNNTFHKSISISSPAWEGEMHIDHVRQTCFFQHQDAQRATKTQTCLQRTELIIGKQMLRLGREMFVCSAIWWPFIRMQFQINQN